ncbi:hypothetical protein [Halolamina sp.]|uniref:hypothetical protein n=1 Tax=Halolamina sp. TaxID=1940283 RepID=UPI003564CF7D
MTWGPSGIDLTERFRTYVDRLRATHAKHAEGGVNALSDHMTEDTTGEAAPTTYRDASLQAAHDARPRITPESGSVGMNSQMGRRAFVATVGAAAAATATAGSAAATETATESAPEWATGRGGLDWTNGYVQNPYFAEDSLTRARHRMEWGTDDAALRFYEDDGGEMAELPGYVPREDTENVLSVRADKYDFPAGRAFPRGENYDADGDGDADEDVSALDATHWSTTGATNGSVSVTDADLDVAKALSVSSSGVASGETVMARFEDVSLQDDAGKRYLQFVANVSTLTAGSTLEVVAIDDDGDEKIVMANPSGDTSNADTFATAMGSGIVVQTRLQDLATTANGDGSFDSIDAVEVRISEADARITFTAFDLERKSRWLFGSYLANEGTDSEETQQRYTPGPGEFTLTGFDTLGDVLKTEDSVVWDVTQPFRYTLGDSTLNFQFRFVEAVDYPGFDWLFQQRGKFSVPSAIDLSHTGLSLVDSVAVPPNRFNSVWTAEGVPDTELSGLDDSAKTFHGGSYDSEGKTVTLRSSASADTVYAFGVELLATGENRDAATSGAGATGDGGGVPPSEGGTGLGTMLAGGGIFGFFGFILAKLRGLI